MNEKWHEMEIDDFVRRFSLRSKSLMWLLGAGASASAGIPTATDLIWEFKQKLYVSQRRVSPQVVSDLSNPAIRAMLQGHIDGSGRYPPIGAADEYAALFEATYPAEADRRAYLDAKLKGGRPSYGHLALATLMRAQQLRIVWTTNFDSLIADACAKVYGTTAVLSSIDLDAPLIAEELIKEERWPIEVKLHGDFRSRRLKNTEGELRHQDSKLRQVLLDSCRTNGLIVAGYSGRDESIMDTLREALSVSGAFPTGLFWLHREGGEALAQVYGLLEEAAKHGIDASLVKVPNFDEALRDLIRMQSNIDTSILEAFAKERSIVSSAPLPVGGRIWPVVRLNALPITKLPTVCRLIACSVGGSADARKAIEEVAGTAIVTRVRAGVIGFGSNSCLRQAYERYQITTFDLYSIDRKHLRYDSSERGLLKDALTTALVRERGLVVVRSGASSILAPASPNAPAWEALGRTIGGPITGVVRGHGEMEWREGLEIGLGWAKDQLWLLIEPRIAFFGMNEMNKAAAADFARERTATRYNGQLNNLLSFWVDKIIGQGEELRALGDGHEVDATFLLSSNTAYSWRI